MSEDSEIKLSVYNERDERAGSILLEKRPEGLYMVWIGVFHRNRGKGYGTRLVDMAKRYGSARGYAILRGYLDENPEGYSDRKTFFRKFGEIGLVGGVELFTIRIDERKD